MKLAPVLVARRGPGRRTLLAEGAGEVQRSVIALLSRGWVGIECRFGLAGCDGVAGCWSCGVSVSDG